MELGVAPDGHMNTGVGCSPFPHKRKVLKYGMQPRLSNSKVNEIFSLPSRTNYNTKQGEISAELKNKSHAEGIPRNNSLR